MGEIIMIDVEDEMNGKTLHLIAKISIKDKKIREFTSVEESYENEVRAYQVILPALMKLQETCKLRKPFDSIPKCYSASSIANQEYIIMENLRTKGFGMIGLDKLLDHEHITFILERYAKLHALSYALRVKRNEEFREIVEGLHAIWSIIFEETALGKTLPRMLKHIQDAMKEKGFEYSLFNSYVESCGEIVKDIIRSSEEEFYVFLHGDCWSNNMMFKYKEENGCKKLDEIKLLDWQACCVGPPVLDLSYVIYSGATKEVIDNLNTYLKIYHDNFSSFLSYFDIDVSSVYPFEELRRQWRKYFHHGAIAGSFVRKMRASTGEYVDAVSFKSDEDSTYFDAVVDAPFNKEHLVDSMSHLCEHFIKVTRNEF